MSMVLLNYSKDISFKLIISVIQISFVVFNLGGD